MPSTLTEEIASSLRHQDYSLAVRRMLDACLDTNDQQLVREAIQWSRQFRNWETSPKGSAPEAVFLEKADALLKKAQQALSVASDHTVTLLQAHHISKTYSNSQFQLQPVDLAISSGEIIGIVGENGNGKTTLLRCLGGQLALDGGQIDFPRLSSPDRFAIRNYIAFIPQRIPRWYGKLKDNLHFSASIAGIHGEENHLMVDFMLERLNLSQYAELNWNQISSGYRTRFEIARILLQKPKLLILDEPLANLDINAQQTILTDLRFMAKSAHHAMGVILSSQQLHEVEKVADNVLFIKQGACLFQSGKEEMSGQVMELETNAPRERLLEILGADTVQIQFNGGFFTISATTITVQQMIVKLLQQDVPISYFRDITKSTKRFF